MPKPYLKESRLQMQVCHLLKAYKIFFWVQPNRGYFDVKLGKFKADRNPYVRKGVPDIIAVHEGLFYGIELKGSTGRLSEHQKAFKADVEAAGGQYYVVASFERALEVVDLIRKPGDNTPPANEKGPRINELMPDKSLRDDGGKTS